MSTETRYYAAPSQTSPASWSVFDRTLPKGRNVEVPHVTRWEAEKCAESLNAGGEAYNWLTPAPPHYVSSEAGPGGYQRLSFNVRCF